MPFSIAPDVDISQVGATPTSQATGTQAPEMMPVSPMSMIPGLPQRGIGDFLQEAIAAYAPVLMSEGRGQNLQQLILRKQEEKRKSKAGGETQSLTGFLSTALASGNPEQLSSAVTQISKLKGLEPETVQSLQALQVKLGESLGQDQQEEKLAAALQQADPEMGQLVGNIVKTVPGMKLSQAVSLLKSGLVGEPAKTVSVPGVGLVRTPGTGVFKRQGDDKPTVLVESEKQVAPTFERDLDAEAQRRGLTGEKAFEFKQKARAEAQGARSFAQGYQGAMGREQAELELPIGENSAKWINPDTGERPDPKMTKGELLKQKAFVPVTAQDLDSTRAARAAAGQISEYRSLIKMYPKSSGNFAQDLINVQSNRVALELKSQAGDAQARRLKALQATIPNLAKALGDAGNVGERERLLTLAAALTTAETQESAAAVLDQLERTIKNIMSSRGLRAPGGNNPAKSPSGIGYKFSEEAPSWAK